MSTIEVTEADYEESKRKVVAELVALLQTADALGKDQQLVAAEVLGAFQLAANEVLGS